MLLCKSLYVIKDVFHVVSKGLEDEVPFELLDFHCKNLANVDAYLSWWGNAKLAAHWYRKNITIYR